MECRITFTEAWETRQNAFAEELDRSFGVPASAGRTSVLRKSCKSVRALSWGSPCGLKPGLRTMQRASAFTLPEVLVASGLALVVVLALVLLSIFASRSFAALANYMDLDQASRLALDKMSREIRQAQHLTDYSPSSLTFQDRNGNPLQFVYDSQARTLSRIGGGQTNVYLTDCDSLTFSNYQGTAISNTFDAYEPAYVTNTKLVQVAWVCSRQILGAKANTESVQSAKITLRNH